MNQTAVVADSIHKLGQHACMVADSIFKVVTDVEFADPLFAAVPFFLLLHQNVDF